MTLGLLKKNLRDVGNVGAMLFDDESREAIKRLKTQALKEAIFDRQVIDTLPIGGTTKTISPEKIKEIHASNDFQIILNRLKMISHASYKDAVPLLKNYEIKILSGFDKGMMATYLIIGSMDTLPDDIGMYLVSAAPEPTSEGWPGNPIGNMFKGFDPWPHVSQKIHIPDRLITDDHYQSLSCTVPLLDDNNKTIALLGIDYAIGGELHKLNKLKWICFALIIGTLLLSFLLSFIISRFLNIPLKLLTEGAKNIGNGDLQTRVSVRSNDEFNILAQEFNNMTQSLQDITVSRDDLETEIIQKMQLQKEKEKVIENLETALEEIKTLKGIVPICANCKKIRDDEGYWNILESYIEKHSDASFSHGMCPDCLDELYGKKDWYIEMKKKEQTE